MKWPVGQYKLSGEFASLAPSTRRQRDNILIQAFTKNENDPFALIEKSDIKRGMYVDGFQVMLAMTFLR